MSEENWSKIFLGLVILLPDNKFKLNNYNLMVRTIHSLVNN